MLHGVRSRYSVVGIVAKQPKNYISVPGSGKRFFFYSETSRPASSSVVTGTSFPFSKAGHLSPSSAEVKNEWIVPQLLLISSWRSQGQLDLYLDLHLRCVTSQKAVILIVASEFHSVVAFKNLMHVEIQFFWALLEWNRPPMSEMITQGSDTSGVVCRY